MLKIFIFLHLLKSILAVRDGASILAKFHQDAYKLKYERIELLSYDHSIFKEFRVITYKFNRTQAATNFTYQMNVDMGFDLQNLVQAFKFASNEYRMFPIRFLTSFCAGVESDVAGFGTKFKRDNPPCPLKKDRLYKIINFYPDEKYFPPMIPSGNYMLNITWMFDNKDIANLRAQFSVFTPIVYD